MAANVSRAGAEGIDLPLTDAAGRILVLPDVDLAVTCEDGRMIRLALELTVPYDVYAIIDDSATFHLEPENRGASFAPFDTGALVALELELASDLVARLADSEDIDHAAGAIGVLMRLAGEDSPDEPILQAASWYATSVKQQRGGGLATGFTTRWAQAERLG